MATLFSPIRVGRWELPSRIVMAPLTRNRSGPDGVPLPMSATYYAQRASAALIITEGTQPSVVGQGYLRTPGIHTDEQVAAWRDIADGVHAAGGHIVVQLMHAGRIAHPDNKDGVEIVAPSPIAAPGKILTPSGQLEYPQPRALETHELDAVIAEFAYAATRAVEAGLDGVEVHGANGYLPHQFLSPVANERTDEYGGSPQARARFTAEVVTAVAAAIGADRVGLRLSPGYNGQGADEPDAEDLHATYTALLEQLRPLGLAYLHLVVPDPTAPLVAALRAAFGGPLIVNTGFSRVTSKQVATELVETGVADLVSIGRLFLANPDLPRRWLEDAELNEPDKATFYGGDVEGYIDYPTLDDNAALETA